jgi:hypothetical protein|tara:strand:- start:1808 stop:2320 length:513 start_codon:yes stop_codon:yes gene_type:complete
MPEQRQTILSTATPPNKPKGARRDQNIRASFPSSPIYNGELSDEERKKAFQELVMTGIVLNGKGINSYDRDFKGNPQNPVPNLEEVETGGGGLPASPYVPNLASPGPGSVNAADQPVYNGELPDPELNVEFGSGMGGLVSPHETSPKIANQSVLRNYISGRSYKGSDGKA